MSQVLYGCKEDIKLNLKKGKRTILSINIKTKIMYSTNTLYNSLESSGRMHALSMHIL